MWYYADLSRQRQGPVSAAQLAGLYAQGLVTAESLVWRQGLPNWQPLGSVAAEVGIATAPPAGLPPPPPAANPYGYASASTPAPYSHNPYAAPQADLGKGYVDGDLSQAVPAGFWKRYSATVIDQFVLMLISLPIGIVLGLFMSSTNAVSMSAFQAFNNLIGLVIALLYYALQESSPRMATLGKRARGLRVLRTDGTRISTARASGRYLAKFLSAIILMIGFIMAAFTERKQGLHDMLADTLVVAETPEKAQLDIIDFVVIGISVLLMLLAIGGIVAMLAALGGMR